MLLLECQFFPALGIIAPEQIEETLHRKRSWKGMWQASGWKRRLSLPRMEPIPD
jgi:hypothetical protein